MTASPQIHPAALSVGRRIKELRHELAISQNDLAQLAQIDLKNVGKYERGQANARLDTLLRLAVALDTTVPDLTRYVTNADLPEVHRQITVQDLREARKRGQQEPESG